jgi:cytochrome c oxidase assembly protein subunit 15
VFLTFDLIVFGAFTRLTDSGLGCPDWPGCYGLANPFLAHAEISAAEALLPSGPVTLVKAWIEMIHRYLAMGIGVLIMALMAKAWLLAKKTGRAEFAPALPTAAVLLRLPAGRVWRLDRDDEAAAGDRDHPPAAGHGPAGPAGLAGRAPGPGRGQAAGGAARRAACWRWLAPLSLARAVPADRAGRLGQHQLRHAGLHRLPPVRRRLVPEMDFEHGFTLWRELGKTAAGHYLPFAACARSTGCTATSPSWSSPCWA